MSCTTEQLGCGGNCDCDCGGGLGSFWDDISRRALPGQLRLLDSIKNIRTYVAAVNSEIELTRRNIAAAGSNDAVRRPHNVRLSVLLRMKAQIDIFQRDINDVGSVLGLDYPLSNADASAIYEAIQPRSKHLKFGKFLVQVVEEIKSLARTRPQFGDRGISRRQERPDRIGAGSTDPFGIIVDQFKETATSFIPESVLNPITGAGAGTLLALGGGALVLLLLLRR